MADKISGEYYPSGASLNACRLTVDGGKQFDIKNNVVELSYFEDLYAFCISGYILVRDGLGLINLFQISGGEKLELSFDNDNDPDTGVKDFVIYKVGDRVPTGNMNSEFYKLYFCTKDLISNEQIKVSKSYKGKKITEIVSDILNTQLQTERTFNTLKQQETFGFYDFIVPTLRPFEAISWLSNYARPVGSGVNGTTGADMFFFENKDGYKFDSLSKMMEQKPKWIYKYQQNNLDEENANLTLEDNSVIAIEFVRSFNTLKDIAAGAFANKVIGVDPLTKSQQTKIFDYSLYTGEIPPVNGIGIQPKLTTLGLQPNQTPDGYVRVVLTNSGEKNANYIKNNDGSSVAQDVYMQETLSLRIAQVAQANHTVIKILVPGNIHVTVGDVIDFRYYKLLLTGKENSRPLDEAYSGNYLVTAVRHVLQSSGVFQTVLEIAKNSSKTIELTS